MDTGTGLDCPEDMRRGRRALLILALLLQAETVIIFLLLQETLLLLLAGAAAWLAAGETTSLDINLDSFAKASRCGVRTCGCPAQPSCVALCWSARTIRTLGRCGCGMNAGLLIVARAGLTWRRAD